MILDNEEYELNGKKIVFRSAAEDDADMLINYLKTVTGETRFLMCESDEVKFTEEGEIKFIRENNDSENALLILAFVDGEFITADNGQFSLFKTLFLNLLEKPF